MGSLGLVKRIIVSNPQDYDLVRNTDLGDNARTSLHLAAELGLPDIAKFLLEHGHESEGVTRTLTGQTALMLASAAGPVPDEDNNPSFPLPSTSSPSFASPSHSVAQRRFAVARLLIERDPSIVGIRDRAGMDAFAHAAQAGTNTILVMLLSRPAPATALPLEFQSTNLDTVPKHKIHVYPHPLLNRRDEKQDTPLHHAAAFGHLKTVRLLVGAGADYGAKNAFSWTPVDYSASVNAEVYVKNLIREKEQLSRFEGQGGSAGSARGSQESGRSSPIMGRSSPVVSRTRGASDEKARQLMMAGRGGGVRLVRSSVGTSDDEDDNHDENEIGLAMGGGRGSRERART